MQALNKTLLGAGLLAVAATSAQAGLLRFTIEAPGIQTSQVSGHTLTTETFDSYTPGSGVDALPQFATTPSPIGKYEGSYAEVNAQDVFGGATQPATPTNFLQTDPAGYSLDFTSNHASGAVPGPVGYFGFWWSAGNGNNELIVSMVDSTSQTFSTQSIIDSPNLQGSPNGFLGTPSGHYGNPNGPIAPDGDYNSDEVYAFVNIYALNAQSKITGIQFREVAGGVGRFESDNHTISTDLIPLDNQTGDNVVPIPATALLLLPGLAGIGLLRRRRGA